MSYLSREEIVFCSSVPHQQAPRDIQRISQKTLGRLFHHFPTRQNLLPPCLPKHEVCSVVMTTQRVLSRESHDNSLELTLSGNFSEEFSTVLFLFLLLFKNCLFLFYAMNVFSCMCVCAMYMPDILKGQKRASDTSVSELQMLVRCHVGAGNQVWLLCKNSKCC